MSLKYCIGIDLGKNGAIVVSDNENNDIILKKVMPIIGKDIDVKELINILQVFKETQCIAIIEDVRAIVGASSSSTFTFGFVAGVTEAALIALNIPYVKVNPKVWQKLAFVGVKEIRKPNKKNNQGKEIKGKVDTKAMALLAAKRLFPNVDLRATQRSVTPHDGIVDALLISWYAKQIYS